MVEYQHLPPGINQVNNPGYPWFVYHPRPVKYDQKVARSLGGTHIAIGLVCILLNSILIGTHFGEFNVHFIAYGIWGGILFIIPGILGVLSGIGIPNKCLIIATMVMDIIVACLTSAVFSLAVMDASFAGHYRHAKWGYYHRVDYYDYSNRNVTSTPKPKSLNVFYDTNIALASIMSILALLEAVISIVGSALCCRAVCCTGPDMTSVQYNYIPNQQIAYDPNYPGFISTSGGIPVPSVEQTNLSVQHDAIPPLLGKTVQANFSQPSYQKSEIY